MPSWHYGIRGAFLPKSTERSGANQSTRELADIFRSVGDIDKLLFSDADNLPYIFVAANLRNLPREKRQENVID